MKDNFTFADFDSLIKTLNKQKTSPRQIEILTSLENNKKINDAVSDYVWQLKNPVLDQPKQKWHRANGFYKVLKPFHGLMPGDNVLMEYFIHTRVVKLATSKERQVFFDVINLEPEKYILDRNYFSADMKFTPEQWGTWLRPLTKSELIKLLPHISNYIKTHSFKLKNELQTNF